MSICTIFIKNLDNDRNKPVGIIQKHYNMNNWLLANGVKDVTYELYKGDNIHSIWIWKEKNERWGRTATPSTKEPTIIIDPEYVHSNDCISRKKARQVNHKDRCKRDRQYRI